MFKILIFFSSIFIIFSNVAHSKSFNINCEINTGYEYNRGTDISGKYMPDGEGKSSGMTAKWNFVYSGQGQDILINKKKHIALPNSKGLTAIEHFDNGMALTTWTYAINFELLQVTAAMVNTHNMIGMNGLKAKAFIFDCQ